MRFFEILGSGGLQLVEEKKAQEYLGLFSNSDFLTYSCFEDMIEKIAYSIQKPEETLFIRNNALKKAKKHTFDNRAKEILSYIGGV